MSAQYAGRIPLLLVRDGTNAHMNSVLGLKRPEERGAFDRERLGPGSSTAGDIRGVSGSILAHDLAGEEGEATVNSQDLDVAHSCPCPLHFRL
jgi:hypothetical protein